MQQASESLRWLAFIVHNSVTSSVQQVMDSLEVEPQTV